MSGRPKVTIYHKSDLMGNIIKTEARLVEHGTRKYAQYDNAVFVNFVPKRKRKVRGLIATSRPYVLILEGWGHPDPDSLFGPAERSETTGVGFARGRYSAFSGGWVADFEKRINPYLESGKAAVVADYREVSTVAP